MIDGRSVYMARKELGVKLAASGGPQNSVVTGMPDSGTLAALGFSQKTGLPFEMGIVRNRYVGRTFIQPTQLVRDIGVRSNSTLSIPHSWARRPWWWTTHLYVGLRQAGSYL